MRILLVALLIAVTSAKISDEWVTDSAVKPLRRANSNRCGGFGQQPCDNDQCDLGLRLRGRGRTRDCTSVQGGNNFVKFCPNIKRSDWSPAISNPRADGCKPALVNTRGGTCADFCKSVNLVCVRAQDNVGSGCGLDDRHTRQSTANSGCNQKWNNQICVCGKEVCRACGGGGSQPPCIVDGEAKCHIGKVPNAAGTLCRRCGAHRRRPCPESPSFPAPCHAFMELTLKPNQCSTLGIKECYGHDQIDVFHPNQPQDPAGFPACHVLAQTNGLTCQHYCAQRGMYCVRGQDNVGSSCDLDSRHDRQKDENGNPLDGCNQAWQNQVCGCAELVCQRDRCGRRGHHPCGDRCNRGLTPVPAVASPDTTCQPCGRRGQPSCDGTKCNAGLRNNQGTCENCGAEGQPICDSAPACDPGLEPDNEGKCADHPTAPAPPTGSPTFSPGPHPDCVHRDCCYSVSRENGEEEWDCSKWRWVDPASNPPPTNGPPHNCLDHLLVGAVCNSDGSLHETQNPNDTGCDYRDNDHWPANTPTLPLADIVSRGGVCEEVR